MRKVKQVAAKISGGCHIPAIDGPINEFIETLPKKGDEIVDIKYATDNREYICFAVVEYEADA